MFGLLLFGAGTVWLGVLMLKELVDSPPFDDPSRCPACHCNALLRVQREGIAAQAPLLHCRHCNRAYWRWQGSLIRDTGRPLF
jgi:uncharacterized protein with PIN domain